MPIISKDIQFQFRRLYFPVHFGSIGGPGSSVDIATGYGLDGPGIESRRGGIFRPSRTALGAHPASCTMGTGPFMGVKYGRSVLLTTHSLLLPLSWKSRAIPLPTVWATAGPVTGTLYILPYAMKLRSTLIYRVDCDDGAQHMTACPRQERDGRQEMTRNVLRNNRHSDCSAVPVPYL